VRSVSVIDVEALAEGGVEGLNRTLSEAAQCAVLAGEVECVQQQLGSGIRVQYLRSFQCVYMSLTSASKSLSSAAVQSRPCSRCARIPLIQSRMRCTVVGLDGAMPADSGSSSDRSTGTVRGP